MTEPETSRNNESDNTKGLGQGMIWIAWICGIGLAVWLFQDMLDKQWNPNTEPLAGTDREGRNTVVLEQNRYGHYVTKGEINGTPVVFFLDTGATQVSIPAHIAKKLKLESKGSGRVNTANGTITVYPTQIDSLSIGSITLNNVSGHINPFMREDEILLGMSALKRVEFTQNGKRLTLRD